MVRKGYMAEKWVKDKLVALYGKDDVIKVAIAGKIDYIVLNRGRIVKGVEVKECHQSRYTPSKREIEQFKWLLAFAKRHKCNAELWVLFPQGRGKPPIVHCFENKKIKEVINKEVKVYG